MRPQTMQSSLPARHESHVAGPEPVVVEGRGAGKRRWFGGLINHFGSKPSGRPASEPSGNALLEFPSEAAPTTEPAPTADVEPQPALESRQPAGKRLVRSMVVLLAIVVVAGLGLLANRLFALRLFTTGAPPAGHLTIDTRSVSSEVLVDGQIRGVTP